MLLSQSHIQIKDAERARIALAVEEYQARGAGGAVLHEPSAPRVEPKFGPSVPLLFGARERKPKPKPAADPLLGACRMKRDRKAPRIAELVAQGWGVCAIAREVGMSHVTVRRTARENGIQLREPPTKPQENRHMVEAQARRTAEAMARRRKIAPRVANLAVAGLTARQIAKHLDVSTDWIKRVGKENSITFTKTA